jgi:hypothetical protein
VAGGAATRSLRSARGAAHSAAPRGCFGFPSLQELSDRRVNCPVRVIREDGRIHCSRRCRISAAESGRGVASPATGFLEESLSEEFGQSVSGQAPLGGSAWHSRSADLKVGVAAANC